MSSERITRREFIKDVGGGLVSLALLGTIPQSAEAIGSSYSFEILPSEYRFFRRGKHFMSIVTSDNNGSIIDIRPHPDGGDLDNAWGSSLYLQPFLPGAILSGTNIDTPRVANDGITIDATGKVSRGASQTFGIWNFSMKFSYSLVDSSIDSTGGTYSITLDDKLSDLTGDLNLFKIASNFLIDVPLISGGRGNTGDMSRVDVFFNDKPQRTWVPTQGTTYPGDSTNNLAMDVIGNYNEVSHVPEIISAYKPNMRVKILRNGVGSKMILGTAYDELKKQDPYADNVSILPLILKTAPEKIFNFDIWFESTPFRKSSARNWEMYQ